MANSRFQWTGLLLVLLAIPVWALDIIEIRARQNSRSVYGPNLIGPIVLCCITVSVYWLRHSRPNAWPLSALISGLVILALLYCEAG